MNSFNDRQTAMMAYIPFVGFLIAFSINRDVKSELAAWHIKNMFGLFIMFFVALVVQSQIDIFTGDILWLISFLLWIYSLIMAFKRQEKGVPFFGDKFQEWFTFLN